MLILSKLLSLPRKRSGGFEDVSEEDVCGVPGDGAGENDEDVTDDHGDSVDTGEDGVDRTCLEPDWLLEGERNDS